MRVHRHGSDSGDAEVEVVLMSAADLVKHYDHVASEARVDVEPDVVLPGELCKRRNRIDGPLREVRSRPNEPNRVAVDTPPNLANIDLAVLQDRHRTHGNLEVLAGLVESGVCRGRDDEVRLCHAAARGAIPH